MNKFAIIGAGGHGRVISDILLNNGFYLKYVIDDEPHGKKLNNISAICLNDFMLLDEKINIALAIGNNKIREDYYKFFIKNNFKLPSIIHKSAIISPSAIIEEACVIMPNVVVNANSIIKKGVILNTSCVVEHDCVVGEFAHISPNTTLCGAVKVGRLTHIGAGSVVIPCREIGDNCIIGAGSVVIDNIKSNKKIVGNPAKKEL